MVNFIVSCDSFVTAGTAEEELLGNIGVFLCLNSAQPTVRPKNLLGKREIRHSSFTSAKTERSYLLIRVTSLQHFYFSK